MHYSFFVKCLGGLCPFVIEVLKGFTAHGSLMDPVNILTDITFMWIGHDVISFNPRG